LGHRRISIPKHYTRVRTGPKRRYWKLNPLKKGDGSTYYRIYIDPTVVETILQDTEFVPFIDQTTNGLVLVPRRLVEGGDVEA